MKKLARIEVRMEALVEHNVMAVDSKYKKQTEKYYIFDLETGKKLYVPNDDPVQVTLELPQKEDRLELPISKEAKEICHYKNIFLKLDPRNKYISIEVNAYYMSFIQGFNLVDPKDGWKGLEDKKTKVLRNEKIHGENPFGPIPPMTYGKHQEIKKGTKIVPTRKIRVIKKLN